MMQIVFVTRYQINTSENKTMFGMQKKSEKQVVI
ncbi:MAG: hypothetical protein H6Q17_2240 [Bacteroidetes bacterium]|nr:hypothetical protein [Bacteroidota bacterium]